MRVRLVTDENISWRIKKMIPQWEILPSNEIKHGKRLTDISIWKFAKENKYNILTFDEDFSEPQNLKQKTPSLLSNGVQTFVGGS